MNVGNGHIVIEQASNGFIVRIENGQPVGTHLVSNKADLGKFITNLTFANEGVAPAPKTKKLNEHETLLEERGLL